jgi:hypothetical protein
MRKKNEIEEKKSKVEEADGIYTFDQDRQERERKKEQERVQIMSDRKKKER